MHCLRQDDIAKWVLNSGHHLTSCFLFFLPLLLLLLRLLCFGEPSCSVASCSLATNATDESITVSPDFCGPHQARVS